MQIINLITKNIYTIIKIIAITVIIFVGVDTFFTVFEAKLEQPDSRQTSVTRKPIKPKKEKRQEKSARYYDIIKRRSIFGTIADENTDSAEVLPDPDQIDLTSLNIKLTGTAPVTGNPNESAAFISVKSNRQSQGPYYIGDSVEGALIKAIYSDLVILDVNGKDEKLLLDETSSQSSNTSLPPGRPPVSQTPSVSTRTIPLERDEIEEAFSDFPTLIKQQASVKTHYKDGEADGLSITGVKSGSIFRKMGLRNGDVVQSVEGNEIKSIEDLASLYPDLQSADSVSIQIIRRGRPRNINLKFR